MEQGKENEGGKEAVHTKWPLAIATTLFTGGGGQGRNDTALIPFVFSLQKGRHWQNPPFKLESFEWGNERAFFCRGRIKVSATRDKAERRPGLGEREREVDN